MRALLLFTLWISVSIVHAESERSALSSGSSLTTELKDVLRDKKFQEDTQITDLEIRAQAGSLSRYSFKVDLSFAGPPLDDLNNVQRPNPDHRPGDYRTDLSGTMGLRYRLSSNTALNFGTGLKWFAPYQAVTGESSQRPVSGKNYDINDPQVAFDDTYAVGPLQMRSGIRAAAITTDYFVHAGQWGALGLFHSVKFVPQTSRLIFGLHLVGQYYTYDRDYRPGRGKQGGDGRVAKYFLLFVPGVEYRLMNNLNLVGSLAYSYQNLRSEKSWWNWNHDMSALRLGVGWAVLRDVYINPYISFFAEAPAFTTASLGFNTVFSVF